MVSPLRIETIVDEGRGDTIYPVIPILVGLRADNLIRPEARLNLVRG